MPRPRTEILTEREAQIMDALWRFENATADQVRAALPDSVHDSTVRTLLRILEAKGYVAHSLSGKSYLYRARIERSQAQKSATRQFLARLFGGSAESLVLRLIEDEALTPAQLEEIRKSLEPRRAARRKGASS